MPRKFRGCRFFVCCAIEKGIKGRMEMAFTEKELEKKSLSEIGRLVLGYEQKIKELAGSIMSGLAKPADMMALNSDLALLKKMKERKVKEQNRPIQQGQSKAAAPLKSYDDYMKNKKK
jgi:hypothetical protein